jgi:chorismate synthase
VLPELSVKSKITIIGTLKSKFSRKQMIDYLEKLKIAGKTVPASARLVIGNCPQSLGEPVFDKLKADLAKALLSIGGCTSFSFSGRGIEGGISTGEKIIIDVSFKAPATKGKHALKGRHDPCILPRALPVIESMVRFVLADHFLRQKAYEN